MKKRILSVFLAVMIACSVFAGLSVSAAETKVDSTASATSGTTGDCTWNFDKSTGTLTISGNGKMGNIDFESGSKMTWYDLGEYIKSVVIENGVTNIGDGAFCLCDQITSISIPNSVTSIGDSAFLFCMSLASITIPDSVTSIGDAAFFRCTSLESITIPNSVTKLGEYAFYDCESLTSITIPKSVTSIGEGAFYGCTKLSDVYYKGTKSQWNKIKIINSYDDNTPLLNAKIHCQDGKITPAKTTIKLTKTSAKIYVKGKTTIKATVKNGKGKTTYKSSNTKVAKVSSKGVVTAVKAGTAKITVTNNGVKQTFKVTVKNPKLNATKKTLKVKKSFTLKITGKVGKATFTSSNKKIATVNSKGKITAKKKGTATITVKTNGIKLKCKVTVKK
jgi:hypothetical protein